MLWPPIIKVWEDGRVVFYKDKHFLAGEIAPGKLQKLRSKLAGEKFLRTSRYIETKRGALINIHGGVAYIRYLDGAHQVLLATELFPRRGKWNKLISMVRTFLPDNGNPFLPSSVCLLAGRDDTGILSNSKSLPDWPFNSRLNIPETKWPTPAEIETSDPEIIRFLFQNLQESFSFFTWDFRVHGEPYFLELDKVPGWYNDSDLRFRLMELTEGHQESSATRHPD